MHFCYAYSGIPIDELLQMDVYSYRILLINAYVNQAYQSKEGIESLRQYARCKSTNSATAFDTAGLLSIIS